MSSWLTVGTEVRGRRRRNTGVFLLTLSRISSTTTYTYLLQVTHNHKIRIQNVSCKRKLQFSELTKPVNVFICLIELL